MLAAVLLVMLSGGAAAGPPLGQGYEFEGNGKRPGMPQTEAWRVIPASPRPRLPASPDAVRAARVNLEAAAATDTGSATRAAGNLRIGPGRLQRTATLVAQALATGGTLPPEILWYRCSGEDRRGNVHFTGYFTPRLEARLRPDRRFRFPLYRLPAGMPRPWPTREAIERDGALASRSLELAWTDDLLELYFLHVQGSGQLALEGGVIQPVEFAGGNGRDYLSLGRHLVERGNIPPEAVSLRSIRAWMRAHPGELVPLLHRNPSYTFFRTTQRPTRGAAKVELVAGHSVAADPRVYPPGACLLAEVPLLDRDGRLRGHTLRVLFVHDTGGAIQGPGHLDLYHGVGREAGDAAGDLHHYGRIWLLLAPDP